MRFVDYTHYAQPIHYRGELSTNQLVVLVALRSFKPYHNGKDAYELALAECWGLVAYFPDRLDWTIALDNLKAAGLIGPRNGVTKPGQIKCRDYPTVRKALLALV